MVLKYMGIFILARDGWLVARVGGTSSNCQDKARRARATRGRGRVLHTGGDEGVGVRVDPVGERLDAEVGQ